VPVVWCGVVRIQCAYEPAAPLAAPVASSASPPPPRAPPPARHGRHRVHRGHRPLLGLPQGTQAPSPLPCTLATFAVHVISQFHSRCVSLGRMQCGRCFLSLRCCSCCGTRNCASFMVNLYNVVDKLLFQCRMPGAVGIGRSSIWLVVQL
jgi:hypothetical protein